MQTAGHLSSMCVQAKKQIAIYKPSSLWYQCSTTSQNTLTQIENSLNFEVENVLILNKSQKVRE
jgi:hypothetical protein